MTSKNPSRSCEDVDEAALSYAEVKALATVDPRIKEKMDLDVEIAKLRILKSDFHSQKYQYEDGLAKRLPKEIQAAKTRIANDIHAIEVLKANPISGEHFPMEIEGKHYLKRKDAGGAIIALCLAKDRKDGVIGTFRGFEMRLFRDELSSQYKLELKNQHTILSCEVSGDDVGIAMRINNTLEKIPTFLENQKENLAGLEQQVSTIKEELKKTCPYSADLKKKEDRMATLLLELADSEKEQAAKRALRRSGAKDNSTEVAITDFLDEFVPEPAKTSRQTKDDALMK